MISAHCEWIVKGQDGDTEILKLYFQKGDKIFVKMNQSWAAVMAYNKISHIINYYDQYQWTGTNKIRLKKLYLLAVSSYVFF